MPFHGGMVSGELASAVRPKIEQAGIEFIRRIDEAVGDVEIDPGFVHSALMNIFENAVDACLRDEGQKDHRIEFDVRRSSERIIFDVTDNGVGMDAATVSNLFTPFFSSKGRGGTGLGLFISNQIIRQHGGTIQVKSTPGRGSRFSIAIPKNPPEEKSEQPSSNVADPA